MAQRVNLVCVNSRRAARTALKSAGIKLVIYCADLRVGVFPDFRTRGGVQTKNHVHVAVVSHGVKAPPSNSHG